MCSRVIFSYIESHTPGVYQWPEPSHWVSHPGDDLRDICSCCPRHIFVLPAQNPTLWDRENGEQR